MKSLKEDIIALEMNEEGFLSEVKDLMNPESFIDFLEICAHNITMPLRNQIALLKQEKGIYDACGRNARLEVNQENLDELLEAVVLYYNLIQNDDIFTPHFIPIKVLGDTAETIKTRSHRKQYYDEDLEISLIPDMITRAGMVIEAVPAKDLKHPINKADYDAETGLIRVSKSLTNRQFSEVLISSFTRIYLERYGHTDRILQASVVYVVSKYFGMLTQGGIKGILFNQAFEYPLEEFAELLERISIYSFDVVEDLIGQLLSFDETAIINSYLDDFTFENFSEFLMEMQQETDDAETVRILSELAEKIDGSTIESVAYLVSEKASNGFVYTYPPYKFDRRKQSDYEYR